MERECDSKRIEAVRVYRPKWTSPAAGASTAAAQHPSQAAVAASSARKRRGGGWLFRLNLYSVVFMVLYAVQVSWVLSTIGEPYRTFLEKADREGFQGTSNVGRGPSLFFFLATRIIILTLSNHSFFRPSPNLSIDQSCRGRRGSGPSSSTAWSGT
jgi:hypothetical protein